MKFLLSVLISIIAIISLCGQRNELNINKILLFELDKSLKTQFFDNSNSTSYNKSYFSYLKDSYPGYNIKVAFSKSESDSLFQTSNNIIRVTSSWHKRYDPNLVCCMGGDCKSWQITVQAEIKKNGSNNSKYLIEEYLDKNLIMNIIDLYEKEQSYKSTIHNQICVEGLFSYNKNQLVFSYIEKLKSETETVKINFDNIKYTCSQRCFLTDCTKLIISTINSSEYKIDFINFSDYDISIGRIVRSDTIRNKKMNPK